MSGTSNYAPYEPNAKGFTEALIDFKDTLGNRTVYSVAGFEAILNGDADECPENAFAYVGSVDEAFEKAKGM